MRISDADRQRAVDELRRHCAEGRLEIEDYAGRVEKAMGASTLEELDAIRGDLPMLRIARPDRRGPGARADAPPAASSRAAALVVVLVAVAVVLAAVVLAVVASWVWAVILVVGWAVGRLQAAAGRRR